MNPKMTELGIKLAEFIAEYENYPYRTIFIDRRTGKDKIMMTEFEEGEEYLPSDFFNTTDEWIIK